MNVRHRVLVTDRFEMEAHGRLKGEASLEVQVAASPDPTDDELRSAEALIIRSRTRITKELLARAPELKVIVTATSGFDHIDFKATEARGVRVMHTPEANADSAAELTWALVLACARRIPEAEAAVRSGDWSRERLVGFELSGKTYGVIGLGRIGSRVARIARAFGMQVIAYDPYREDEDFAASEATRVGLDELLRLSDVVSLHVPRTHETSPLLHSWRLTILSSHAILVNTSRGQAIDEPALVEALKTGRLRAAGLDVFHREPLKNDSYLLTLPNVVLSPHLGATTMAAFSKASLEAAEKVIGFFKDGRISDVLPPQDRWYTQPFMRPKTE